MVAVDAKGGEIPENTILVVVRIHGTFARRALWVRPDSAFANELRVHFGNRIVLPPPFNWSGHNSPRARLAAATALTRYLRDLLERYPNAKHFIIGHSHGGNIALQALAKDAELRERISGVITLSTPFVSLRLRAVSEFGAEASLRLLFMFPLMILLGFPGIVLFNWLYATGSDLAIRLYWLVGIPSLAVIAIAFSRLLGCAVRKAGLDVVRGLTYSVNPLLNLMIVRFPGDEASALLATSQFVSWLVGHVWRACSVISRRVLNKRIRKVAATFAFVWAMFFAVSIDNELLKGGVPLAAGAVTTWIPEFVSALADMISIMGGKSTWDYDDMMFFFTVLADIDTVTGIFGTVVLIPTIAVWLGFLLLGVLLFPFGAEVILAALMVEVSVEAVPPGVWQIHQWQGNGGTQGTTSGLAHSALYQEPRIIEDIAHWINANSASGQ